MRSRAFAALAAMVTAAAGSILAVAPVDAVALNPPQLSIATSSITVHTANGQQWKFSLSTFASGQSTDTLDMQISRSVSHPAGSEIHSWLVPVPSSVLAFNTNTGHGTVKTPSSVASLTTVNMAFARTGARHVACTSGSETVYAGNLSGRATLITGLHGGGTVGGRNLAFKAGTTHLTVDNGCQFTTPESNACSKSVLYNAGGKGGISMFGYRSGRLSSVDVSHNVSLKHPAGTTRQDVGVGHSSKAPVFNKTAKTLQIWGSSTGVVTGAGKFKAGSVSQESNPCVIGNVHHTEVQQSGNNAVFQNATGHPVVAHTSLTGKLTVPGNSSGYFFVDSWH